MYAIEVALSSHMASSTTNTVRNNIAARPQQHEWPRQGHVASNFTGPHGLYTTTGLSPSNHTWMILLCTVNPSSLQSPCWFGRISLVPLRPGERFASYRGERTSSRGKPRDLPPFDRLLFLLSSPPTLPRVEGRLGNDTHTHNTTPTSLPQWRTKMVKLPRIRSR